MYVFQLLPYLTGLFLIFNMSSYASALQFYSQASQDAFVYTLLNEIEKKTDTGYYLEIGSADPLINSNTYFLEKTLGWKGISLEIIPSYQTSWVSIRKNPLLIEDATKTDYISLLSSFPKLIDYLSLDVDGEYDTILKKIPFDQYRFKVITIEHDFYRFGDIYREKERAILASFGYLLLCPDVSHPAVGSFEDWWIHPKEFSKDGLAQLLSVDLKEKYHDEIISILR